MFFVTCLALEGFLTACMLLIFCYGLTVQGAWQRRSLFLLAAIVAIGAASLNATAKLRSGERMGLFIVHAFFLMQTLSWLILKPRVRRVMFIAGALTTIGLVVLCLQVS